VSTPGRTELFGAVAWLAICGGLGGFSVVGREDAMFAYAKKREMSESNDGPLRTVVRGF
jgi:hypothetical protein